MFYQRDKIHIKLQIQNQNKTILVQPKLLIFKKIYNTDHAPLNQGSDQIQKRMQDQKQIFANSKFLF